MKTKSPFVPLTQRVAKCEEGRPFQTEEDDQDGTEQESGKSRAGKANA